MIEKKYDIFHELRNKNVTDETILICLKEKMKESNNILDIKKYNKNLLFISTLYDNANAFTFFSKNFGKEFSQYFKETILFIYPNKNPDILKLSFENLPILTDEDKITFITSFSRNCYREENIEVVQNWLLANISKEYKQLFISKLIEHNNTPFLKHISKNSNWKEDLISEIKKANKEKEIFYMILTNEPILEIKRPIETNQELIEKTDTAKVISIPIKKSKPSPSETTIIIKKRKTN